jgi:type II secretory pathway pseudopilin PulG
MALFSSPRPKPNRHRPDEGGYVLLCLLLVVSLMAIFALAAATKIDFEIKRDQEQEMIHRGVQYSRAIRGYFKKWGRYPARLEDLENTNNLRYLRKRYKDPITGKDFRLLHYGEPGLTLAGAIGGGAIPGATPAGSAGLGGSAQSGSAFGGSGSSSSAFGNSGLGGSGVNSSGVFSQSSGLGGNSNSGFGANSTNASGSNGTSTGQITVPDGSQISSTSQDSSSTKTSANGATDLSSSTQLVTSGPIVGVASTSKKPTIREFNKKRKYNEWQFIYDPGTDRGGLIKTPNQPSLPGFGNQPGQNMQAGGANSSAFGNSNGNSFGNSSGSSFGQSSGFGNNPNPGGPALPTPPPNPPQQQ